MDPATGPAPNTPLERDTDAVDVIVLGAGTEASHLAAVLAGEGWSVLLLEPRGIVAPLSALRLGGLAARAIFELGLEAELEARRFPRSRHLAVLGRGSEEVFEIPTSGAAWQVRTADLEQLLRAHAISRGAVHRRGQAVRVMTEGDRVVGLHWEPASVGPAPLRSTRCATLVDASGSEAFLSRQAIAGPRIFEEGAALMQVQAAFLLPHPLSPDEMARVRIYHDGPGHWAACLPISAELVSVSVVVPQATYQRHAKTPAQLLDWGLAEIHPELRVSLIGASRTGAVDLEQIAPYRIDPRVGDGWLCLGRAHRQEDPLFSLGASLALAEAEVAATALLAAPTRQATAQALEVLVERGAAMHDTARDLTRYFWRFPGFFRQLVRGRLGRQFCELLEGSSLSDPDPEALSVVRGRLTAQPLEERVDRRAEELVHRVRDRYEGVEEVQAAFLELGESGARLSLVLDEAVAEEALLHDFEESLYREFGRDYLVVIRWSASPTGALSAPDFETARRIFDRRAS